MENQEKYYREIEGDLIKLALEGNFDVIAQIANCFCTMGAGIAVPMKNAFGCDEFPMELQGRGDINKLGQIDYLPMDFNDERTEAYPNHATISDHEHDLIVVNMYGQFNYGKNHLDGTNKPIDYEALTLCLRKLNYISKGLRVGLPLIGCGLAGGSKDVVIEIIKKELKDCYVTLVLFKK